MRSAPRDIALSIGSRSRRLSVRSASHAQYPERYGIAMNGDQLTPGEYSVLTSYRNFEGRQGKRGRTFLASPLTAAVTAITGTVTDVRSRSRMKKFASRVSGATVHRQGLCSSS